MITIKLKKDWVRNGLKTVPAGTIITIDEALHEKLNKKGLFTAPKKAEKTNEKK